MATQYNYPTSYLRFGGKISPVNSTHNIGMLDSFYLQGGLKTIYSIAQITDSYNTRSWIPDGRRQTGSIIYVISESKYYIDEGGSGASGYSMLPALTTGSPTFPGFTSSAGILITNGANISFSAGGNIATTGTASFNQVTASNGFNAPGGISVIKIIGGQSSWQGNVIDVTYGGTGRSSFTPNGVLYGYSNNGLLVTAQGDANSVLIANGGAPSFSQNLTLGGNIKALGTASFGATTVSGLKSNGIISGSSTLDIIGAGTFGGLVNANGGISTTTINSSGLATLATLYVQGDTQLGNGNNDTTSVFGTLSVTSSGGQSDIYTDTSGNLVLDGAGSSGVQISDGLLWLGASSSTGLYIQSGSWAGTQPCGAISSSLKYIGKYGFANGTTDIQASFQVDKEGNLQCYSLKETSLREYKHQIQYITGSQLANIARLKPITFLYNIDNPEDVNDTQLRQAGFIAEQVEQIYPQVAWYKDGALAGLQYQRLTAYLTRGVQQLTQKNNKLQHRLDLKDKAITKLNKQVKEMKLLLDSVMEKLNQK